MVKITMSADCGNSPKKLFLKQLNIAYVEGDLDFIADSLSNEITWDLVGEQRYEGKSPFLEAIEEMKSREIEELVVHRIITHGKEGAVSGEIRMQDGQVLAFCDVYEFQSAKGNRVRAIESYVIEVPQSTK